MSDIYSATLRTWFFRVSYDSMRITLYGMFLGTLIGSILLSLMTNGNIMNVVHGMVLGTMIGSIVGELRNSRKPSFSNITKTMLGTLVGIFGMTIKMIVGVQMIEIFVFLSDFPKHIL